VIHKSSQTFHIIAVLVLFSFVLSPFTVDGEVSKHHPEFAEAAKQNAELEHELSWVFGGRTQRGWVLYASLIKNTIGTSSDTATEEFAEALDG
jgi:hypothetical protein